MYVIKYIIVNDCFVICVGSFLLSKTVDVTLASLCGVRITILRCDTLTEIRYRHEGPLKEVCIGLLYNGKEEGGGHYSPLVRVDGEFLESTMLYVSEEYYDEDVDKEEREFSGEEQSPGGTIF